jgi:hypothetical protein
VRADAGSPRILWIQYPEPRKPGSLPLGRACMTGGADRPALGPHAPMHQSCHLCTPPPNTVRQDPAHARASLLSFIPLPQRARRPLAGGASICSLPRLKNLRTPGFRRDGQLLYSLRASSHIDTQSRTHPRTPCTRAHHAHRAAASASRPAAVCPSISGVCIAAHSLCSTLVRPFSTLPTSYHVIVPCVPDLQSPLHYTRHP